MSAPQRTGGAAPRETSRAGQALVAVGIVALALNLRPTAVSVGPVLDEIRDGVGLGPVGAGILTSLPVLAFALFGALAPGGAARVGPHRLTTLALVAVSVGLAGRSRVDSGALFLALSLLALAGMATANVVLPSLVKRHFPTRVGTMTAVYSTALAIGLTSASVLTVPISEAAGAPDGWRTGLGSWAAVALIALVPWVLLLGRDRREGPGDDVGGAPAISFAAVARTRLGWLMAGFFGLQSLQAYALFGWIPAIYRDAGFTSTTAGVLLGVLTGTSIPLSFLLPWLAGRLRDLSVVLWVLGGCYTVGYVGLA